MRHGQRSQQKRINEAEYGRIGANSEPDRNDRRKGKAPVLAKGADGIADVVQHVPTQSKATAIEILPESNEIRRALLRQVSVLGRGFPRPNTSQKVVNSVDLVQTLGQLD